MAPLLVRSRKLSGFGLAGILARLRYIKKSDEELAEGMRLFTEWTTAAPEEVQPETQHDRLLMAALLSTKERAPSGLLPRTVSCPDSLESIDALMVLPAQPTWTIAAEAAKEMDPPNSLASTVSLPPGWDSLSSTSSFNLFSDPVPSLPSLFAIDPAGVPSLDSTVAPWDTPSTSAIGSAPETSLVSIPSTFFTPPRPVTSSTSCIDPSCVHRFHDCTEECFEVEDQDPSNSTVSSASLTSGWNSSLRTSQTPYPSTSSTSSLSVDPSETLSSDHSCTLECYKVRSLSSSASSLFADPNEACLTCASTTSSASITLSASSVDPSYIHRFHDCTEECFEVEAEVTHVCASSCFEFDPPGHTCDYDCFRVAREAPSEDVSDDEHTDATSCSSLFPDPRSARSCTGSCTETSSSSSSTSSSAVCPDCHRVHEDESSSEDEEVDEDTDAPSSSACSCCSTTSDYESDDEAAVVSLKTATSATTQTPVEQTSAARALAECEEMLEKMVEMMEKQFALRKRLREIVDEERK